MNKKQKMLWLMRLFFWLIIVIAVNLILRILFHPPGQELNNEIGDEILDLIPHVIN